MAIKFKTQFDDFERIPTCAGCKEKVTYHMRVDERGVNDLVADDVKFDWYGMIQASTEGCSIEYLLKKYEQTGDISLLQRKQGSFFDVTDLPDSLIGMYKKIQEGERYFNELPLEVRESFDNSFTKFLAQNGEIKTNNINKSVVSDENISVNVESEVNKNDK